MKSEGKKRGRALTIGGDARTETPSPTMEETSTLLKVFNKDAWHNIPKCMVDIIEALIEASESNRYSLMENFKKNMNQFSTFDTKM